jgi:predicted  nucleic acid-binding Zn-ribbon protein
MENSIEKNLNLLLELQNLDSRINEIVAIKDELPQEAKALADKVAEFSAQLAALQEEQVVLGNNITSFRIKITEIQNVIKRCEEHKNNIRNNREYDALTKEIELYSLDIQLHEKKIRDQYDQLEQNKAKIVGLENSITEVQKDLDEKKASLQALLAKDEEEHLLAKERQAIGSLLDQSLLLLYEKIKDRARNKVAVVVVKGGACGGCFTAVYPQMQADIKEKKKVYKCENCNRIFADVTEEVTILTSTEEVPVE